MAQSIDGSVAVYGTSGSSATTGTLTCSNAGNYIYVAVTENGAGVSSISATGVSSWTNRGASAPNVIELWEGFASGTFNAAITVNMTASASFLTIHAFGVSGCPSSSPFDSNSSIPQVSTGANPSPIKVSTNNANDIILDVCRESGTPNPSPQTGFTQILGSTGSGFTLSQYQVVSSTQSNLSIGDGNANANGEIADALIAATAGDTLMGQAVL